METDIRNEVLKVSPAIGVSVTGCLGIPVSDWVYIITFFYVALQALFLLLKMSQYIKHHCGGQRDG